MSEYLRYRGFKCLRSADGFDVNLINEKTEVGYFVEVDLEYPNELHELDNDYPSSRQKLAFSSNMLSKYCKEIARKYEIKVDDLKKEIQILATKLHM